MPVEVDGDLAESAAALDEADLLPLLELDLLRRGRRLHGRRGGRYRRHRRRCAARSAEVQRLVRRRGGRSARPAEIQRRTLCGRRGGRGRCRRCRRCGGTRLYSRRRGRCGWCGGRGSLPFADLDAEVFAQRLKAAAESRTDGAELPLALVAVQLADDDRRLHGEALPEIVAQKLRAARCIEDANVRARDLGEILPPGVRIVDRRRHGDFFDRRGNGGEIDAHLLLVAARRRSDMLDRTRRVTRVAVEHEVRIALDFSPLAEQKRRRVEIDGRIRLPAHADEHAPKPRVVLRQIGFLSLADVHTHAFPSRRV